jgi:hypothetical protein
VDVELSQAWQTYRFVAGGRPIASYSSYGDAAAAIAFLEAHAPALAEHATIVARDVFAVQREPEAADPFDAAVTGGLAGSATGVLSSVDELTASLALYGVAAGFAVGALIGAVAAVAGAGRRFEAPPPELRAGRFDVVAAHEVAEAAAELVDGFDDSAYDTASPRQPATSL